MVGETLIEFLDEEDSITNQLKAFDRSDAERNRLINRIWQENQALKEELRQKTADYEIELQARRSWQSQAEKVAVLLEHTKLSPSSKQSSQNYVLCLIDGNSCLFLEEFLRSGAAGGAEAADKLHHAIQTHFENLDEGKGKPLKILLRLYLDLDGFFRRVRAAGFPYDMDRIHQFAQGFTQRQPLFDLVDVGHFSPHVPLKIKELLSVCVTSAQCRHFLLGCNSDDLATILKRHWTDDLVMNRITLVKPSGSEIQAPFIDFAKAELGSVFRTSPLPARVTPTPASMFSSDNSGQSAIQNWNSGRLLSEFSNPRSPSDSFSSLTNGHNPGSSKSTNNGHSSTHSQDTSNGHSSDLFPLDTKDKSPTRMQTLPTTWGPNQRMVLLNINGERVDSNLGPIDAEASARVAKRFEQQKLCNDFHLRGKCWTSGCTFGHEPRLDPKELVVLRYKARYILCEKGSACRVTDCWHGHMCSSRSCTKPAYCRFKDFHHIDKVAVTVWGGSPRGKS